MSELLVRFNHAFSDLSIAVDLRVSSGERLAIVGPSGCGKTTLLRILLGLEACDPDQSTITLDGKNLSTLPPARRELGWVPQGGALVGHLNVSENIALGLRARKVPKPERDRRVKEWLQRVGLSHREFASVATLSGGEIQRVALARAMVWQPRALLLDEPFSALDAELRKNLRDTLKTICQDLDIPVLIVTHDGGDIEGFATDVASFEMTTSLKKVSAALRRAGPRQELPKELPGISKF